MANPSANIPAPSTVYLADCEWITTHYPDLVGQYPDQWIAVQNQRVVAFGHDLGVVATTAELATHSSEFVYEFIASGSMIF